MTGITKIIQILGGIDGEGHSLSDLISDTVGGVLTIGGALTSVDAFTYVPTVMKSLFIKSSIVSSVTSGLDIGSDFTGKFVEQGYTTIAESNSADAFEHVSQDKLISFLWDNYSGRTQVMNIKIHIDGGKKTYFENIGGTYNVHSAVPHNLFRTMFENQCASKLGPLGDVKTNVTNLYPLPLFFVFSVVCVRVCGGDCTV